MTNQQTASTTTRTRKFIASAQPSIGFFPFGLLGLILVVLPLLYGVTHFANTTIEADVQRSVEDALRETHGWVHVTADGQNVHLSGQGSEADGAAAMEIAERVAGGTWAGSLTSPIDVTGDFEPPEPAPEPVWADTRVELSAGVLTLRGEVSDEDARDAMVSRARALLDPPRLASIQDELVIASGPTRPESLTLGFRAVDTASACIEGHAAVESGEYSIRCTVTAASEGALRASAEAPIDVGTLGEVRLAVDESQRCDQAFSELLQGRRIQFAVNRANLRRSSASLLDEIAEVARTCPGSLRVEGHTDARGALEANMTLSRARADAVVAALVERGIDGDRLVAEGFGPNRPRAEGESAEAHAENRRIEFHIVPVGLATEEEE